MDDFLHFNYFEYIHLCMYVFVDIGDKIVNHRNFNAFYHKSFDCGCYASGNQ